MCTERREVTRNLTTCWPVPAHFSVLKSGKYDRDFIGPVVDQILAAADAYLESDEVFPIGGLDVNWAERDSLTTMSGHAGENSMYHIMPLVEAYYVTGDVRYAEKATEIIPQYLASDWVYHTCTNLSMAAWWQGMLPSVSWLLQAPDASVRDAAATLLPALKAKIEFCGNWLANFVANPDHGNNHWTVAAAALGQTGLALGGAQGAAWLKQGLDVFLNHILVCHKLGPRGHWYEDTSVYHTLVVMHTIQFADALRDAGVMDLFAQPKIRAMLTESFLSFSAPDGTFSDFNDGMADHVPTRRMYVLARGVTEYASPGMAFLIRRAYNYRGVRTSCAAMIVRYYDVTRAPKPAVPTQELDRNIAFVGQIISRSSWAGDANWLALCSGEILPHSHFDRGTFTFYYRGHPVTVDTGHGQPYTWDLEHKRTEMHAGWHNTAFAGTGYRLGDKDDSRMQPFDAITRQYLSSDAMCHVEIDTSGLATCAEATRKIFFAKCGYVLIVDELADDVERDFHMVLHGIGDLTLTDGAARWRQDCGVTTDLHVLSPEPMQWQTGEHPVFSRHGVAAQNYVDVQIRGSDAKYVICLLPKCKDEDVCFDVLHTDGFYELRIERDGFTDLWLVKSDTALVDHDGFHTDARITWVRLCDGALVAWGVNDGWEVSYNGAMLLPGGMSAVMRRVAPLRRHCCLTDVPRIVTDWKGPTS
jgi:heparinase II/III-like protein